MCGFSLSLSLPPLFSFLSQFFFWRFFEIGEKHVKMWDRQIRRRGIVVTPVDRAGKKLHGSPPPTGSKRCTGPGGGSVMI